MADSGKIERSSFRKRGRASEEAAARGGGGGGGAKAEQSGRGPGAPAPRSGGSAQRRRRGRGGREASNPSGRPGGLGHLRGADSGPGARPGAWGLRGGAGRGQGGAGGAAVRLQVAPRGAILDRSSASKRAAGRRSSPRRGPRSTPLTWGRAAAGTGLRVRGCDRLSSSSVSLPAQLHSAIAAPRRLHRKRPGRSQSALGCWRQCASLWPEPSPWQP